jgi:formylglycine-generating enzyme required for sulfatase activity
MGTVRLHRPYDPLVRTCEGGGHHSLSRCLVSLTAAILSLTCSRRPAAYREPVTGMQFLLVEPGDFDMGSPPGEPGRRDDERQHRVTLTHPFYMATTEVTQGQWLAVMEYNPSQLRSSGPRAPVETINWFEAEEFVRRLNGLHEGRFRLPTEAEWEYVCRAGSRNAYSFGHRLAALDANYDGRYPLPDQPAGAYRGRTTPVASFRPNAWGFYDMHGNVWEWCADQYCPYPDSNVIDPLARCGSPYQVIRGGSWYFGADSARSGSRYTHEPRLRGFSIGFRVVLDAGDISR